MSQTEDPKVSLAAGRPEPCSLTIFGASGDLTARKLMPSLYHLYLKEGMPESFLILGAARSGLGDGDFRDKMKRAVQSAGLPAERWGEFAGRLFYQPIEYDDLDSYHGLKQRLASLCDAHRTRRNRVFNLAIPPNLLRTVAQMLGKAGLSKEEKDAGWVRLVVEKPFGRDLESARELNQAIAESFREDQVFRIDHYMAKDTVQNIFMFRFANSLFEPIWNRNYIQHVLITAFESLGVEHRAGYYEQAGVLRDMVQNHMMQLLALVADEPPSLFEAELVRNEKVKLFRALRPFPLGRLDQNLVLGQYRAGKVEGTGVPGYREEPRVDSNSVTPTFAAMKLFVDNWRWQGVPFYLTSGKRLAQKITRIDITFKEVPHSLFRGLLGEHIHRNRLTLGIHPDQVISMGLQAKKPGNETVLRPVTMKVDFREGDDSRSEAYEKSLADAMRGDHMLFWRQDGLEQCWEFLDPVLRECEQCRDRAGLLHGYPAGSWGPEAALRLLPPLPWL